MSLRLPEQPYTYASFIEYLKYWQAKTSQDVRIVCYVSELEGSELRRSLTLFGHKVIEMGEIFEVKTEYFREGEEQGATFYCFYDEPRNIFLAFTTEPAAAIDRTLGEWVKSQRKLYYLWINPKFFVDINNKILNEHPGTTITSFNARRAPWNKFERIMRPDYERSIEYHGDDGRFAFEEMSHFYGVLPTAMEFMVPRMARFRMTDDGLFTFKGGNLDFVFNVINEVLSRILREKEVIREAKFEFIPVTTGTKQLQLVNLVPISINFTRSISYDESINIVDALRKNDFEVYDLTREEGSLHLSGTVYDKQKKSMVDLTGNADRLTLSPHGDVKFDSLMRLYRALADYVDVEAMVTSSMPFDKKL